MAITKYHCNVYESSYGLVEVDHPPLNIQILHGINITKDKPLAHYGVSHYNFRKADYCAMYQLFQYTEWNDLETCKDVNLAVEIFF